MNEPISITEQKDELVDPSSKDDLLTDNLSKVDNMFKKGNCVDIYHKVLLPLYVI